MEVIEELQKLATKDHVKDLETLRQRIIELENKQTQQFSQLTLESKNKGTKYLIFK